MDTAILEEIERRRGKALAAMVRGALILATALLLVWMGIHVMHNPETRAAALFPFVVAIWFLGGTWSEFGEGLRVRREAERLEEQHFENRSYGSDGTDEKPVGMLIYHDGSVRRFYLPRREGTHRIKGGSLKDLS